MRSRPNKPEIVCFEKKSRHHARVSIPPESAPDVSASRARGLTPAKAAARLAELGLPGIVFFDTARLPTTPGADTPGEEPLSLLAAQPHTVLDGQTESDWARFRATMAGPDRPKGFAAGWVEYDGAFRFGLYDGVMAYRHRTGEWLAIGNPGIRPLLESPISHGKAGTPNCNEPCTPASPQSRAGSLSFCPEMAGEAFMARVRRAQEYIASGDIYQVNLAHRFSAPLLPDALNASPSATAYAFYKALRSASPAPYAAFLSLGNKSVLSSSPELFLKIDGRRIRTRPIKGTRPRHADPHADEASARELLASAKEAAELIMITDLERNDLGQVCEFGSVRASELLKLECYEQVFHLVSTVEGILRPGIHPMDALRACFPGGSITGAPKKRAREIIAELEPAPRRLYTGAIGYFGLGGFGSLKNLGDFGDLERPLPFSLGGSQFNIAIRTVVMEGGKAYFHVGAGIVADSVPAREWQETLDKAAGILLAARRFSGAEANPDLRAGESPA